MVTSGSNGFDDFAITRAAVVLGGFGNLSSSVSICFLKSSVCEVSRSLSSFSLISERIVRGFGVEECFWVKASL